VSRQVIPRVNRSLVSLSHRSESLSHISGSLPIKLGLLPIDIVLCLRFNTSLASVRRLGSCVSTSRDKSVREYVDSVDLLCLFSRVRRSKSRIHRSRCLVNRFTSLLHSSKSHFASTLRVSLNFSVKSTIARAEGGAQPSDILGTAIFSLAEYTPSDS